MLLESICCHSLICICCINLYIGYNKYIYSKSQKLETMQYDYFDSEYVRNATHTMVLKKITFFHTKGPTLL